DDIRAGVPLFERFCREVDALYPDAVDKLKFNETIKRMLDRLVGDLIRNTQQRLEAAGVHTLDGVRNHQQRLAALSAEVEKERGEAKSFLYNNLYFSPSLAEEKDDAELVIGALFTYWMEKPSALPHNYQDKAREEPLPRVVCDYIAGMTDNYIYEQYEKFCGS